MKIDLHVHTTTGSDGALPVDKVMAEACNRRIDVLSITDHDSTDAQAEVARLARLCGIRYVTGIELNVTFPFVGKSHSLDFLGYCIDPDNAALADKLKLLRQRREERAGEILARINTEFAREGLPLFTDMDMENIRRSVDGAFGRPHIARYMVGKGIVSTVQEAFDRYLVKCDVPKYPLTLEEASDLVRGAGGVMVIAHPDDPGGTSLAVIAPDLESRGRIMREYMLRYIDGVECWHPRHDARATAFYAEFARHHNLLATGGSDCHQKPVIMGSVEVPEYVARQFASVPPVTVWQSERN